MNIRDIYQEPAIRPTRLPSSSLVVRAQDVIRDHVYEMLIGIAMPEAYSALREKEATMVATNLAGLFLMEQLPEPVYLLRGEVVYIEQQLLRGNLLKKLLPTTAWLPLSYESDSLVGRRIRLQACHWFEEAWRFDPGIPVVRVERLFASEHEAKRAVIRDIFKKEMT